MTFIYNCVTLTHSGDFHMYIWPLTYVYTFVDDDLDLDDLDLDDDMGSIDSELNDL